MNHVDPSSPHKRPFSSLEFVSPLKPPQKDERVKKCPRLMFMLPRRLYSSYIDTSGEILGKIEEILKERQSSEPEEAGRIFNYLDELALKDLSIGQKLAELGILYFYLSKCPSLAKMPQDQSYLEARYQEISHIASSYKLTHREHCGSGLARLHPSGSTAYLMRAFARMILPPNGHFNLAGCYAVKELLNSSLGSHLSEEMHLQILSIIETLMTDPELVDLLLEPCHVHLDMEEIIRIDLKLPVNTNISPSHVRWHLLIALFSVLGQTDENNCTSVSTTSNLFRNYPKIIVTFSRELLTKATFSFENVEIPILMLLSSKRKHEADFLENVTTVGARELLSLQIAHQVFGTENKELAPKMRLLYQVMKEQFGDQADQAKEIALSLKMNLQQQCIMAALEFVAQNSLDTTQSISPREDLKQYLVSNILNDFLRICVEESEKTEAVEFEQNLSLQLINNLLFVNYREWSFFVDQGRICFPDHPQGIKTEHDPVKTWDPFHFIKRLCFLKDGMLTPIDTLSGLGETLLEIVDLTFPSGSPLREKFKKYIESERFKKRISFFVQHQNEDTSSLKWQRYYKSDSLFFLQNGGYIPLIVLWPRFNGLFETKPIVIENTQSPLHFFLSLCEAHKAYIQSNPAFLKRFTPLVLTTKSDHAFNLTPTSFSNYFTGDPQEEIQQNVTSRGEALMNQAISWKTRCNILRNALANGEAKKIINRISRRESDFNTFRGELSSLLSASDIKKVDAEINKTLTHISLEGFLDQIPSLLRLMGMTQEEKTIMPLTEYILKNFQKKDYSLFELALILQHTLLHFNYLYLTHHQADCYIADVFQFPRKIDLGNLNWVNSFSEILCHSHLILDYDISKRAFFFSSQTKKGEEKIEQEFAEDFLKRLELFFPKY